MTTGFTARLITFLSVCFLSTFFASCSAVPRKVKAPTVHLQTETGAKIDLKGDAQEPAKVSESNTSETLALPKGSTVETVDPVANSPRKTTVILSADSSLVSVTKSTAIEGPKSFAPPLPPSPTEQARGQAVLYSYGLSGLLILAGLTLLYLEHGKAAGFCLVGAALVPIASNLLTNRVALEIGGGCLLIGSALYAAWHLMQRNQTVSLLKTENLTVSSSGNLASPRT